MEFSTPYATWFEQDLSIERYAGSTSARFVVTFNDGPFDRHQSFLGACHHQAALCRPGRCEYRTAMHSALATADRRLQFRLRGRTCGRGIESSNAPQRANTARSAL